MVMAKTNAKALAAKLSEARRMWMMGSYTSQKVMEVWDELLFERSHDPRDEDDTFYCVLESSSDNSVSKEFWREEAIKKDETLKALEAKVRALRTEGRMHLHIMGFYECKESILKLIVEAAERKEQGEGKTR